MEISVIGAGRVGTALAVRLRDAGHRIVAVAGRGGTAERARRYLPSVSVLPPVDAARRADVVIIGTPDDAIETTCAALAAAGAVRPGAAVAHLSGATSVAALGTAAEAGATTLSIHPLQTCPSVDAALERLAGCPFAITSASEAGLELGETLARGAGGQPFRLDDTAKPLYHAAAVLASNGVVALTSLAQRTAAAAGLDDPLGALAPLQRATLENVRTLGPEAALTGPAARGDARTIDANLTALAVEIPDAVVTYVALARAAMDVAERDGRLDADGRAAVEEVLARWT